ncbi:hypothetical protein C8029_10385 [Roseobacter sp. TSBP12]|nr:hypothetical protein C8029_10385 [Roseobacter sp. TSBP12]
MKWVTKYALGAALVACLGLFAWAQGLRADKADLSADLRALRTNLAQQTALATSHKEEAAQCRVILSIREGVSNATDDDLSHRLSRP